MIAGTVNGAGPLLLQAEKTGEELLLHVAKADDGEREHADGRGDDIDALVDAPLDDAPQATIETRVIDGVVIMMTDAAGEIRQQFHADVGRENDRDEP